MYPNIILGNAVLPSWHSLLLIGVLISSILAIWFRPPDFPLTKKEILVVAVLLVGVGLLGARILFISLHLKTVSFNPANIFSPKGGFAYFGALVFCLSGLFVYSAFRRVSFLALIDYIAPFLMLSQVFVRMGCLMTGCCYGKPADKFFGVVFKTVDGVSRHPTQAYEALGLFLIYIIGRKIYDRARQIRGLTMASTLALYGLIRFFIEYLRTDSPLVLFNLSLAQVACLALLLMSVFFGGLIIWKR